MKKIICYVSMIAFLSSCCKEPTLEGNISIQSYYCIDFMPPSKSVIETDSSFQSILSRNHGGNTCADFIDFSKYTLLCNQFVGGCNDKYWGRVTRDDVAKKYIHTIYNCRKYCSTKDGQSEPFFAVVPKLPSDYSVEFRVVNN